MNESGQSEAGVPGLINALERIASWLNNLGVGIGGDRLHKYVYEITHNDRDPASISEAAEQGFEYIEMLEFISIHQAYKDSSDSILRSKLKRALKGDYRQAAESTQNSDPRNTMFEIGLAARLKLLGLDVELGEPLGIFSVLFPHARQTDLALRPSAISGAQRV